MQINKEYMESVFKAIEILKNENKINLNKYIKSTKDLIEINKTYNNLKIEEDLYMSVIAGFNRYFENDTVCNITVNSFGKPFVNLHPSKKNNKCNYYEILTINDETIEPLTEKYSVDLLSFDANAVIEELYQTAINSFIKAIKGE